MAGYNKRPTRAWSTTSRSPADRQRQAVTHSATEDELTSRWLAHVPPRLPADRERRDRPARRSRCRATLRAAGPTATYLVASDGGVFNFGNLPFCGSIGDQHPQQAGRGHGGDPRRRRLLDGGLRRGDLRLRRRRVLRLDGRPAAQQADRGHGRHPRRRRVLAGGLRRGHLRLRRRPASTARWAAKPLNKPIVGMAATPDGGGYWLVASDGGIFAFGDAHVLRLDGRPAAQRPDRRHGRRRGDRGLLEVASDGGIFAFDGAPFYGSMGGTPLNKPIVGMEAVPTGRGYRFVASDGGIFSFPTGRRAPPSTGRWAASPSTSRSWGCPATSQRPCHHGRLANLAVLAAPVPGCSGHAAPPTEVPSGRPGRHSVLASLLVPLAAAACSTWPPRAGGSGHGLGQHAGVEHVLHDRGDPVAESSPNVAILDSDGPAVGRRRPGRFRLRLPHRRTGARWPGWPVADRGTRRLHPVGCRHLAAAPATRSSSARATPPTRPRAATRRTAHGQPLWFTRRHRPRHRHDARPTGCRPRSASARSSPAPPTSWPARSTKRSTPSTPGPRVPLTGWPFFTSDSVFSTAALGDLYGTGQTEIVEGATSPTGFGHGQSTRTAATCGSSTAGGGPDLPRRHGPDDRLVAGRRGLPGRRGDRARGRDRGLLRRRLGHRRADGLDTGCTWSGPTSSTGHHLEPGAGRRRGQRGASTWWREPTTARPRTGGSVWAVTGPNGQVLWHQPVTGRGDRLGHDRRPIGGGLPGRPGPDHHRGRVLDGRRAARGGQLVPPTGVPGRVPELPARHRGPQRHGRHHHRRVQRRQRGRGRALRDPRLRRPAAVERRLVADVPPRPPAHRAMPACRARGIVPAVHRSRQPPSPATTWWPPTAVSSTSAPLPFCGLDGGTALERARRRHGRGAGQAAGTGWWRPTAGCSPSAVPSSTARWAASTSTRRSSGIAANARRRRVLAGGGRRGVFAFGDAQFFGSMGGQHLNAPIVGIAADRRWPGLLAGGRRRRGLRLR